MTLPVFEHATAADAQQARTLLSGGWKDAAYYAGGIDLLDLMKERLYAPRRLVNIKGDATLKFIRHADSGWEIGPLTTLAEIAEHPELLKVCPSLCEACGRAATPQVRNLATVGGNLCQRPRCWYFRHEEFPCLRKGGSRCFAKDGENKYHAIFGTDESCVIVHPSASAVALTALQAELTIATSEGEQKVPLDKFFVMPEQSITRENVLKPGDLITKITVPESAAGLRDTYIKQREKQSYDWPLADVAVALKLEADRVTDGRIVLGSVYQVPLVSASAMDSLKGNPLDDERIRLCTEAAVAEAKPLAQNEYKVQLVKVLLRRALASLREQKAS